jgi:hypothetical protein
LIQKTIIGLTSAPNAKSLSIEMKFVDPHPFADPDAAARKHRKAACIYSRQAREKQMSRSILIASLLSLTALGLSACQGERLKESSSVGAEFRHLPEVEAQA